MAPGKTAAVQREFRATGTEAGIQSFQHKGNGLRVLVLPLRGPAVATVMLTYHVGSRNEAVGFTGATHLLEHLMFKGARRFNREIGRSIWHVLQRVGASINATTWTDRTNYYSKLPCQQVDLALAIEADRMRGALLRQVDLQQEMTVVRNEYERGDNQAAVVANQALFAAAFQAHPYHHPTIGWLSDIENTSIEQLRRFYDTFYWPNNATVTVIGNVDVAQVLGSVHREFGAVPRSPQPIPRVHTREPRQLGPRRVVLRRATGQPLLLLAFKVPGALHADSPALHLLALILADGRPSRLHRALVDSAIAVSVGASANAFRDPGLLILTLSLAPGVSHARAEAALLRVVQEIKKQAPDKHAVTPVELQRAKTKVRVAECHARDGTLALAAELNEAIAAGDWRSFPRRSAKFTAVSVQAVRRAAATYLNPDAGTTVWYEVLGKRKCHDTAAATTDAVTTSSLPPDALAVAASSLPPAAETHDPTIAAQARTDTVELNESISAGLEHFDATAGVRVHILRTSVSGVIRVHVLVPGGVAHAASPAVAWALAAMLDKGSARRNKHAIASALEDLGASIAVSALPRAYLCDAVCTRPHLQQVVSLLMELMHTPQFPSAEFALFQHRMTAQLDDLAGDVDFIASQAFLSRVLPTTRHPLWVHSLAQQLNDIAGVRVADMEALHRAAFGTGSIDVLVVGDAPPSAQLRVLFRRGFASWPRAMLVPTQPQPKPLQHAATGPSDGTGDTVHIGVPDKASTAVRLGAPLALTLVSTDLVAVRVALHILGGNFSSRLMQRVRDDLGLTYGVSAELVLDAVYPGAWYVAASFAPSLLARGIAAVRQVVAAWQRDGVTVDELTAAQTCLLGMQAVAGDSTAGIAAQLLQPIQLHQNPGPWLQHQRQLIAALTVAQVNAAIRKHLSSARVVTITAGSGDAHVSSSPCNL